MVADVEGRPKRMPEGEKRSNDGGEVDGDEGRRGRPRRGRGRRGRGKGGPRGEEEEGESEGGIKVSCCSVFGFTWSCIAKQGPCFSPVLVISGAIFS